MVFLKKKIIENGLSIRNRFLHSEGQVSRQFSFQSLAESHKAPLLQEITTAVKSKDNQLAEMMSRLDAKDEQLKELIAQLTTVNDNDGVATADAKDAKTAAAEEKAMGYNPIVACFCIVVEDGSRGS